MDSEQRPNLRPVVGSIYHDKSGRSLAVLTIVADRILLEYASGAIASVDVAKWRQLQPQIAVY